jgi:hypothetical protein
LHIVTTNLFERIPSALFNPLAAQSAPLYTAVLLRLFEETQRHQQPLSRDLAVNLVADILSDATDVDALVSDNGPDDHQSEPGAEGDDLLARASGVLRYLAACGWLRVETQSDYTIAYTLPAYAFRLLNVLHELASNEPPRLRGMICAIHDLLQAARQETGDYVRLREAHYQTRYLLQALKELQHNIGEHIQQVLEQLQARDVLQQVFTSYRDQIVDSAYHQLRTTDHVSRFRPGILDALHSLDDDKQIEHLAQQMRLRGEVEDTEEAAQLLSQSIADVRDHFEFLDRLLTAIDTRHSQFVDSAVRSVEHQLTASSTTSGQLHALLTHLLTETAGRVNEPLPAAYMPLISLFALELADADSLAPPTRAAVPFTPEPVALPQPSDDEIRAAHERTLQQMNRAISRERVRRYAASLLRDQAELPAAELPLDGPDDLPLLIYLRYYGDGSLGYQIEEQPDGEWIERAGVGFRAFVLRRA